MSVHRALSQPFNVMWRSALVRLPRAVPTQALYLTSPEGPQPFVLKLRSRGRHEIPIYVFVPPNIAPSAGVIVDFHGGGFFLGSCLEQAPFCAKMARELGAVVISVDYRLGPVDQFPAAVEDGEDVLDAILNESSRGYQQLRNAIRKRILEDWEDANKKAKKHKNKEKHSAHEWKAIPQIDEYDLDTNRLAISGFSSGGNLALNLGVSVTDPKTSRPWPTVFSCKHKSPIPLILYYPAVDLRQLPSERTKPPNLPLSSPFWSEVNDMLAPTYLPRDQASHPRASPGLTDVQKCLHEMARIQLVLPELDDLAHQNELWAQKVQDAGRGDHLQMDRYKGMQHGWTQMPDQMLGKEEKRTKEEVFDKTVRFIRNIWDGNDIVEKIE
jgi:acetyl esterase/lipase